MNLSAIPHNSELDRYGKAKSTQGLPTKHFKKQAENHSIYSGEKIGYLQVLQF